MFFNISELYPGYKKAPEITSGGFTIAFYGFSFMPQWQQPLALPYFRGKLLKPPPEF